MQQQQTQRAASALPFALQGHSAAFVKDEGVLLGDAKQDWSWQPIGDFKTENLSIYASGGNSTTRQTGAGQWDSGEFM